MIEKLLKAHFVHEHEKTPPKLRDLVRLSSFLGIEFSEDQLHLMEQINDFYLEARYPEQKLEFYKLCNKECRENYFKQILDLFQWLKLNLKY